MLIALLRSPRERPKGGVPMVLGPKPGRRVDLLDAVGLLHRHLDEALCEDVFREVRGKERRRWWTLQRLVEFWTAVVVRAPRSLTEVLEEGMRGGDGLVPKIETTSEAFFERCHDLPAGFFAELFRRFGARVLPEAPACYESGMAALRERFPEVWAIDGSRLDALAHRLKILWDVRAVVLGGCVLAFYDVFRGITRVLRYEADAAASEDLRAHAAIEEEKIPAGTLFLGDRLYSTAKFFAALGERALFGLTRRRKGMRLSRVKRLKRVCDGAFLLQDTLVEAGGGNGTPVQTLRWIRLKRRGRVVRDLLTNVLDPQRLSAEEAVDLYPLRWDVERLFYDVKEVLNLHRFYAANPNAVAMQLYATVLVHTAFRVLQGRIAQAVGRAPEELSPAKLFPRLARASMSQAVAELTFRATQRANPGVRLRAPEWRRMPWAHLTVEEILVEPRAGYRRRRRYCASRATWKSLAHIPGGSKLT